MNILPYSKKEIHTQLSAKEIENTLSQLLDEYPDLKGYVSNEGFRIERTIRYQNPFKPIFLGQFVKRESSTDVTITSRPKILPLVFFSILIGMFVYGAIKFSNINIGTSPITTFLLGALIVFVLLMIGFNFEKSKTLNRLLKKFPQS